MTNTLPEAIELGLFTKPLSVQLENSLLDKETLAKFDMNAQAVDNLLVHGLISGNLALKLRERILNRAIKALTKAKGEAVTQS